MAKAKIKFMIPVRMMSFISFLQCMSDCDSTGFKTRMLSCTWTKSGQLARQGSCDSLPMPRTSRKCKGPPCSSIGTISKFPGSSVLASHSLYC